MRVLNETPDELSLTHPSAAQRAVGSVFAVLGAALFAASALGRGNALFDALAAAVLCALGLAALFANTAKTVEFDKRNGEIRNRTRRFLRMRTSAYPLAAAAHVELRGERASASSPARRVAAFLVLADGTRICVGEARSRSDVDATVSAGRVARFLGLSLIERNVRSRPFKE